MNVFHGIRIKVSRLLFTIFMIFSLLIVLFACSNDGELDSTYMFINTGEISIEENEFMIFEEDSINQLTEMLDHDLHESVITFVNQQEENHPIILYYTEFTPLMTVKSVNIHKGNIEIEWNYKEDTLVDGQVIILVLKDNIAFDSINGKSFSTGINFVLEEEQVYVFSTSNSTLSDGSDLTQYMFNLDENDSTVQHIFKTYHSYNEYMLEYPFLLPVKRYIFRESDFENHQLIILHDVDNDLTISSLLYRYSDEKIIIDISVAPVSGRSLTLYIYYLVITIDLEVETVQLNMISS